MGYIAPIQPDLYFQYINRPAPQDKEDYAKVTKVTRTFHDKIYRELEKKEDLVTEAETKVQQKKRERFVRDMFMEEGKGVLINTYI